MKKTIAIFLWLILVLSLLHNTKNAFAAAPIIKFGYIPAYGFSKDINSANSRGYIYQLLKRMETHSKYQFLFIPYTDVSALLDDLENSKIDVALPLMRNNTLEKKFLYSQAPFGSANIMLVAKGVDYAYFNDPAKINGKTVASYHNSALEAVFNAYCIKNDIKVEYVRSNLMDYHNLDADYYLVSSLSDVFQNYDSIVNLTSYNYYQIFRHNNLGLDNDLRDAYFNMIRDDDKLLHELYLKYYNTNLARRDLDEAEMKAIQGKHFTVGYNRYHAPMQYTNENDEADGVAIEIFNILAERYGFSVKYIPYSLDDPNEYHENLDLLLSLLGDFKTENKYYRSTEEYFSQPLLLITSNENALVKNYQSTKKVIGMLQYIAISHEEVMSEYPNSKVIVYPTLNDVVNAYEVGEIDAMLLTNTTLQYINSIFGDALFAFGTSLNLPSKLYISRNLDPIYLNIFNVIFDYVDPSEFNEILARQTINFVPTYTIIDFVRLHIHEIIFVALSIICIFIFTVYYLQSKRKLAVLDVLKLDNLSGFMTYSFFEEDVEKIMNKSNCTDYILIALDIDSFKAITTYYSYETASGILQEFSKSLETHLKGKDGLITRIFADNFLILCKSMSIYEVQDIINDKIIPQVLKYLEESYPLSLSVGIYSIHDCKEEVYIMADRANIAKNKGKREHRTTVYSFDDDMMNDYSTRLSITYQMSAALNSNEFNLVFQPKVDFKTLKIKGAEALVRWRSHTGETFYPSMFIPVFEENGFIHKLDIYMFTKVCEFVQQYGKLLEGRVISVNISGRSMLETSIVGRLKMITDLYDIDPKMIELEITESAMCEDFAINKVKDFQSIGFSVSIDDFGAGVSSLNRLGNMQANILKLDKTFLDVSSECFRGKVVVQDTIHMAKHLDMIIVAEGVETASQARWLRELDCDIAQGYYFSKPLEEKDFLDLLITDKCYVIEEN